MWSERDSKSMFPWRTKVKSYWQHSSQLTLVYWIQFIRAKQQASDFGQLWAAGESAEGGSVGSNTH